MVKTAVHGFGERAPVPALAPGPRRPLLAGVLLSSEVISFLLPEGPGVRGLLEELRLGVFSPPGAPLRLLLPSTRLSVGNVHTEFLNVALNTGSRDETFQTMVPLER